MNDLLKRFTSRKFLLAVVGIVTVFFGDKIHLTGDQVSAITTLIISFTAAEGVADVFSRLSNIPDDEENNTTTSKSKS